MFTFPSATERWPLSQADPSPNPRIALKPGYSCLRRASGVICFQRNIQHARKVRASLFAFYNWCRLSGNTVTPYFICSSCGRGAQTALWQFSRMIISFLVNKTSTLVNNRVIAWECVKYIIRFKPWRRHTHFHLLVPEPICWPWKKQNMPGFLNVYSLAWQILSLGWRDSVFHCSV